MHTRITLICLSLLALAAAPAIAQDTPDATDGRHPIVGKFKIRATALIVRPDQAPDDTDAQGDESKTPANVKVYGHGGAIATPRHVGIRLETLTNEGETAAVKLVFDNPLKRSKGLHGKLFEGKAKAEIHVGDEVYHVRVKVTGSIKRDREYGATISGRFHAIESDGPVRLRGGFGGVKVSDDTNDDTPDD